jgi:RNA polymerase sigma-70 factor (ECF subfamily)
MDEETPSRQLSTTPTLWSLVYQAHQGTTQTVRDARRALLERYGGAVRRYLVGALRDAAAAAELFQEFALRLLGGAFKRADPARGRFRDFVRTAVFHLIVDYQKRQRARPRPLPPDVPESAARPGGDPDSEQALGESWRDELLGRTWRALAQAEQKTGQPCHTVLKLRQDQPLLCSAELAEQLGRRVGKTFTLAAVRQALHRARDKFADLLLNEVVQSLNNPTVRELEEELCDLGLLPYCRSALQRRARR